MTMTTSLSIHAGAARIPLFCIAALLCICAIILPVAAATTTQNISADADTYIRWGDAYGDTNFGTQTTFNAYIYNLDGSIWGRSLIHFNVSSVPEGATIESATLHAYKSAYTLTPNVYAFRITNPWTETGVTWNNWDSNASIAAGSSAVATTTSAKEWVSWDVTNDVRAYASGTAQNYGWMLNLSDTTRPSSTIKATFNSRENSANTPYLSVTYSVAAPVAAFAGTPTSGTAPLTVQFTDASTNSPTSWSWNFGDGNTTNATVQNPVHTYTSAGTYTVALTATNAGGSNTATQSGYVTVGEPVPAPVAAFTTNVTSGSSPLSVAFTDTSTGNITSYAWDFDNDGVTDSASQNPAYTYVVGGSYTANLTVTGPGGSSTATRVINATCNLAVGGIPVPNPGPATLFAMENNTIAVTQVKCTAGNCPATQILVNAGDGWSGRIAVPAMNASTSKTFTIDDPTIRATAGTSVTYTAVINPDNTVPETSYADNTKTSTRTVTYNGYKGVRYWPGKTAPETYLTFDLHGDIIHSFGNSSYISGKGSNWQTLAWGWNPTDLVVPEGATVKEVRLYIPYCWDLEHEIDSGLTTTTFNGVTITPAHKENDTSNFGAYAQYQYGLVTYDVTGLYVKNGDNVATLSRYYDGVTHSSPYISGQPGSLSPAGFTLAVVYEDKNATRKQIFINEGEDLLGASVGDYGTTETEATSDQNYSRHDHRHGPCTQKPTSPRSCRGAHRRMKAIPVKGTCTVNGQEIGHDVWAYGERTVGQGNGPQVAVDTRNVLSYLNANGTANGIGIQSTAGASPCMVAERSFLVVEYPTTAPVAAFGANTTSGAAPLTVAFTDASTNTPTSWSWNFGDNATSTEQNPVHTYTAAGNFTVALMAANSAGSDTVTRTNYLMVTAAPAVIALPGQTNPPTDPDHDGLYEDLNGNGRIDYGDLQLYFTDMAWLAANEPLAFFDYNGNGRIDYGDIQTLFIELGGS